MKTTISAVAALWLLGMPCFGQTAQAKVVLHPTFELGSSALYLASWSITNIREDLPDNTNAMLGLGWRDATKWGEAMLQYQYQWSEGGKYLLFLDLRAGVKNKRCNAFLELAPFLTDRGLFSFASGECAVFTPRFKFGAETENVLLRPDKPNSWSFGPRFSFVLVTNKRFTTAASLAYQLHWNTRDGWKEPDVARGYGATHPQF